MSEAETRLDARERRTGHALGAALCQGLLVWATLVGLTVLSLLAAYRPLGGWTLAVNLAAAAAMVVLGAAYFMNLRRATALILVTACAASLFLLSMFGLTFNDLLTRF